MVEVGMAQQDVVDAGQFVQGQVADAGAGVDQDILIKQERRGAATRGDRSRTAKDADGHEQGVPAGPAWQLRAQAGAAGCAAKALSRVRMVQGRHPAGKTRPWDFATSPRRQAAAWRADVNSVTAGGP
jgi:hypothetical protein